MSRERTEPALTDWQKPDDLSETKDPRTNKRSGKQKGEKWKANPQREPKLAQPIRRLTSQWSGRFRAARFSAAHRRVRLHRELPGIFRMLDRFIFAVIGCAFGALLGCLLWFLYGVGMSNRLPQASIDPMLLHWMQFTGCAFAALGFIFKERVGATIGNTFATIFHYESGRDSNLNWWQAILILAIMAAAAWAIWQRTHGY